MLASSECQYWYCRQGQARAWTRARVVGIESTVVSCWWHSRSVASNRRHAAWLLPIFSMPRSRTPIAVAMARFAPSHACHIAAGFRGSVLHPKTL